MSRPPRDTKVTITNSRAVVQWLFYGFVGFVVTLAALLLAPGPMSATEPSVPLTMAFVVQALGCIFGGLAKRRDPESGFSPPIIGALKLLSIPLLLTVAAVELEFMQKLLLTTPLSADQWWACIGLAVIVPIVVELDKAVSRRRAGSPRLRSPGRSTHGIHAAHASMT